MLLSDMKVGSINATRFATFSFRGSHARTTRRFVAIASHSTCFACLQVDDQRSANGSDFVEVSREEGKDKEREREGD